MRNETRLAGAEITRERALHVLDRTGLHEEAREMRREAQSRIVVPDAGGMGGLPGGIPGGGRIKL